MSDAIRVPGHALTHLAYRPGAGWIWECECRHRPLSYAARKADARYEHREHKRRIGTPEEHKTILSWPTATGMRSSCICGHDIGTVASLNAATAAHAEHLAQEDADAHTCAASSESPEHA